MCHLVELANVQVTLDFNADDESHQVTITMENSVEETTHALCWLLKKPELMSQVRIKSWVILLQPLHIVSSAICSWRHRDR